ncbi:hypothetical protein GGR52DRAFT_442892 [Hypoxylon sp. FL1284]|nr:hypothetical protein GGR52DRAFT_442892 [Hypoxylon sp. FL1284]
MLALSHRHAPGISHDALSATLSLLPCPVPVVKKSLPSRPGACAESGLVLSYGAPEELVPWFIPKLSQSLILKSHKSLPRDLIQTQKVVELLHLQSRQSRHRPSLTVLQRRKGRVSCAAALRHPISQVPTSSAARRITGLSKLD